MRLNTNNDLYLHNNTCVNVFEKTWVSPLGLKNIFYYIFIKYYIPKTIVLR